MSPTTDPPASAGAADWILVTLPGVIWGASFLFIAEGLRAIGPAAITFVRILVGFATLALIASARSRELSRRHPPSRGTGSVSQ
ncbi:MAG TPA: EamA family transporter [Gemmatimonadales bacterium]|nr:EamA family transporter [Gemmatimonadales bacterium]